MRLAMLKSGYVPLANDDKVCRLRGWPTLEVDEALIEDWSQAWRYRATGVRLEGGLAVADFDINDQAAMDEIIDTMPDHLWKKLGRAPMRHSGGANEAWFFRVEETFGRYCSATYCPPGAEDDSELHVLEVFAGGSSRQFGAYGAHTVRNGDVVKWYGWHDGRGLVDVPYDELPLLTKQDVVDLCNHVSATLKRLDWVTDTSIRLGNVPEHEVFDLTDEVVFVSEDGSFTLDELEAHVRDFGTIRVSASWLLGPRAVNTTRCICSARHDGKVQILETADHVIHRPARDAILQPPPHWLAARMSELRAQKMDDEPKWRQRLASELSAPHNSTGWVYSRSLRKITKDGDEGPARENFRRGAIVARVAAGGLGAFDAMTMDERRDALKAEKGEVLTPRQMAAFERGLRLVQRSEEDETGSPHD